MNHKEPLMIGDVVKMEGNREPCVVYRVIDDRVQHLKINDLGLLEPHVKLEVIGWVPISYLVKVDGHYQNMFAIDKLLWTANQTN